MLVYFIHQQFYMFVLLKEHFLPKSSNRYLGQYGLYIFSGSKDRSYTVKTAFV